MLIVTVVETPEFRRRADEIMSEEERMELIDHVARNPEAGTTIGGGVRKFRFARQGGGKSRGYRVIHYYGGDDTTPIFLLTVFAKNRKANYSPAEKRTLTSLGKQLASEYRSRK